MMCFSQKVKGSDNILNFAITHVNITVTRITDLTCRNISLVHFELPIRCLTVLSKPDCYAWDIPDKFRIKHVTSSEISKERVDQSMSLHLGYQRKMQTTACHFT
jgi:hypothetical protein